MSTPILKSFSAIHRHAITFHCIGKDKKQPSCAFYRTHPYLSRPTGEILSFFSQKNRCIQYLFSADNLSELGKCRKSSSSFVGRENFRSRGENFAYGEMTPAVSTNSHLMGNFAIPSISRISKGISAALTTSMGCGSSPVPIPTGKDTAHTITRTQLNSMPDEPLKHPQHARLIYQALYTPYSMSVATLKKLFMQDSCRRCKISASFINKQGFITDAKKLSLPEEGASCIL